LDMRIQQGEHDSVSTTTTLYTLFQLQNIFRGHIILIFSIIF
jgi:hypothetical protein